MSPWRDIKNMGKVLLLLIDEIIIIGLIVLVMWIFRITIPVWLAVVIALLLGAFAFIVHRAAMPMFHRKEAVGPRAMIGSEGIVIEPLAPSGQVRVAAEYWAARCPEGAIAAGETIEVVDVEKLMLIVKRLSQG